MNVFSGLKPQAIISFAFWNAKVLHCSSLRDGLKRNFSSSARSARRVSQLATTKPAGPRWTGCQEGHACGPAAADSPVSWITNGQSNTSWSHWVKMKGIM